MTNRKCPNCDGPLTKMPFGTQEDYAAVGGHMHKMSRAHAHPYVALLSGGALLAQTALSNVYRCSSCQKKHRLWFSWSS